MRFIAIGGALLGAAGLLLGASIAFTAPRAPGNLPAVNSVVDIHTHVAGLGRGCEGCYVNPALAGSYKFDWYLAAFGTDALEIAERGDPVVAEQLAARVQASRWVRQAVVLALDGVVGPDGLIDREATQLIVPNSYVRQLAATHPEFLYGASINPYRRDAEALLDEAARDGAVLVKWIPAIMHIDPDDPALDGFYERLVALDMPLLVHVGDENAFHHADNRYGDPRRLRRPLELGVRVIAAHLATTGSHDGVESFDLLLPMFERHARLYSEQSSLTQINKLGYLVNALEYPGVSERLAHGSDWPLQFFPLVWAYWHVGRAPLAELKYAATRDNPFDRDIALKAALGVPTSVFNRTPAVLAPAARATR